MAKQEPTKKARAIAQSVTVVSSIPIDPHTRTKFEHALNTGGINITPTYSDNQGAGWGYGSALDSAVQTPTSACS